MDAPTSLHPEPRPVATWMVIVGGALLIVVWMLLARPQMPLGSTATHAGVGKPLPEITLQPLTGTDQPISLDNLRGKVALINFWGTWCPPCIIEFPHMIELRDHFQDNHDFTLVSVSSTFASQENVDEVRTATAAFLQEHAATLPTYIDSDGTARRAISQVTGARAMAYPTTVLVDRAGIIRETWVGYLPGAEREMEELVSKLLAEPK